MSAKGIPTERFDQVEIASPAALRAWLEAHHGRDEGVWLVTALKGAAPQARGGAGYLTTDEILDALLAFGWVDGIRRKRDPGRTMQLIAPRRTQAWTQTYKARVARLTEEGRMHASGLPAVASAKASGLWSFMDDVDALIVPDDLDAALQAAPSARAAWDDLAPSYRRNVLRWIKLAKTAPTRAKRIAAADVGTRKGEKIPQM